MNFLKIPVKTIHLQLTSRPENRILKEKNVEVKRFRDHDLDFYRKYYLAVGEKWGWAKRLVMTDEELDQIIHDEQTQIYYLLIDHEIAGFFEFFTNKNESELVYLGLIPEFIGKGYGEFLLNYAIHKAWDCEIEKLILHTCEYDHPAALKTYLKSGFQVFEKKIEYEQYSEEFLRSAQKIENFF